MQYILRFNAILILRLNVIKLYLNLMKYVLRLNVIYIEV